jgi:SAM-dependent methyltransferase
MSVQGEVPCRKSGALVNSPVSWTREHARETGLHLPAGHDDRSGLIGGHCHICGNSPPRFKFHAEDLLRESPESFPIFECPSCGLLSTDFPQDLSNDRYPDDYYRRFDSHAAQGSRTRLHQERLSNLQRFKSGKRILDVGCGDGSFLTALEEAGWEAVGTEVNAGIVESLRKQGKQVFHGELCAVRFPQNSFDFITYFGSFEHVKSPLQELQQVKRILKQDGLVLFNVTNANSLEAKFFGPNWFGLEVPRHYYNYTLGALSLLLRLKGFRELTVDIRNSDLISSYSLACYLGLRSRFFVLQEPLELISPPYSRALSWFNQGNIIELVASR